MKKITSKIILVVLAIVMAFLSLQSCTTLSNTLSNMSDEDAYRLGYSLGAEARTMFEGNSSKSLKK